ncbi:unnamed protein product, partial [Amoebophrya sp. A120]
PGTCLRSPPLVRGGGQHFRRGASRRPDSQAGRAPSFAVREPTSSMWPQALCFVSQLAMPGIKISKHNSDQQTQLRQRRQREAHAYRPRMPGKGIAPGNSAAG